ncbi:50S ribosomal protein L19e [Candidatus Micrarchaeota archaeon]|nr:50S ribosomal protein L19e [Candidatus Micrarchaeota archaeon]
MLSSVKRLAADILGVGISKIRIKPEEIGKAEEALTREDVRNLIKDKIVFVKRKPGFKVKNRRKRKLEGSRRGSMNSRAPEKELWMRAVRAQRKYLAQLVTEGNIDRKNKRAVYLRIKGGSFRGKKALLMFLKDNGLYVEKKEKEKK